MPAGTVIATGCADLPKGTTCSYDDDNQTMTITPAANTPPGSYPVRVTFTAEREE
jgi:deoxycytidylate deaminase